MLKWNRTTVTLALAIAAILVLGLLRPASPVTGVPVEKLWTEKVLWPARFDVVLAGDSRMYRGLSPRQMGLVLKNMQIANFGFSGVGYGHKYLSHLPRLFRSGSHPKVLMMGITPNSLTESAANLDNGYLTYADKNPLDNYVNVLFGDLLNWAQPFSDSDLANIGKQLRQGYFQHYYPDGWVASYKIPEQPEEAVEKYRRIWLKRQVSPAVVNGLIRAVAHLRKQGIAVYGFEPPTSPALAKLEDRMSGFERSGFIRRFKAAGGHWLDVPHTYTSYDGSHLRRDAAMQFSSDLATLIRTDLKTGNRTASLPASESASKP